MGTQFFFLSELGGRVGRTDRQTDRERGTEGQTGKACIAASYSGHVIMTLISAVTRRSVSLLTSILKPFSHYVTTCQSSVVDWVCLCLQSCSYFTSFTVPLKLALKNRDTLAGNIYAMFKVHLILCSTFHHACSPHSDSQSTSASDSATAH